MKHAIVTRCNFADDKLFMRYFIPMRKFFIPSICAQSNKDFTLYITTNQQIPKHAEMIKKEFIKNNSKVNVVCNQSSYKEIILAEGYNIQTRHDCDDYMENNYVQSIHESYLKHIEKYKKFLLFAQPTKVDMHTGEEYMGRIYTDRSPSMFLSLCQETPEIWLMTEQHDKFYSIVKKSFELPKNLVKLIVHGYNAATTIQKNNTKIGRNLMVLAEKYNTDKKLPNSILPKNGIKGHGYVEYYQKILKNRNIRDMLEIGVSFGSSLKMWDDYFDKKCNITGIDINENRFKKSELESDTIKIKIGDQSDPSFLRSLRDKKYDFILDDGSHVHEHHIISFNELFCTLNAGGVYAIEDLHVALNTIKVFKAIQARSMEFNNKINPDVISMIDKIEFYSNDKLCIIYKNTT